MFLLKELNEEVEYLTEEVGGKRSYVLKGPFLQCNIKNKNGRIYPSEIMEAEVGRYSENYIVKNRAYGELNHPTTPSINLDKVSHIITKLNRDGNNFIGEAKVLDTPNGRIVSTLMEAKCQLGISSRGLGALQERNGAKYVSDYRLTTAGDIVADPSAPEAWLENVVENVEWIFDGVSWQRQEAAMNLAEETKRLLVAKEEREQRFLRAFKKFMEV